MHDWPDVTLESLRKLFPHPRAKQAEMKCLRATLDRLARGEVSGSPVEPHEAVAYLRERLAEAAQSLAGREKRFCPHLTTFLNGRRYLTPTLPPPANLEDAITILACYPTITAVDLKAHMPVLRVIDEHIRYLQATHGNAAASYMQTRTMRYAECVGRWPSGEMQYIPGADKFFRERRYDQDERMWNRVQRNGFESEREQLLRIM